MKALSKMFRDVMVMPSCCGWCEECVDAVLVRVEAEEREEWEAAVCLEREKWKGEIRVERNRTERKRWRRKPEETGEGGEWEGRGGREGGEMVGGGGKVE